MLSNVKWITHPQKVNAQETPSIHPQHAQAWEEEKIDGVVSFIQQVTLHRASVPCVIIYARKRHTTS
eukprot:scaffold43136_cov17-Prasinocladus_malaysianus.AAC.1